MFIPTKNNSPRQIAFTEATEVSIPQCRIAGYVVQCVDSLRRMAPGERILCRGITFRLGIPEEIRARVEQTRKITGHREEYVISLGEETLVYATEEIGFLRAVSTLMQMCSAEDLTEVLLYDYPACDVRGYRVYMPGRETLQDFKNMIDFIVYYKYNAIILEIGGAMEYRRHPKINQRWVEFCRNCSEYSGKADDIQGSQQWAKDSIHYENGDGAFLTQAECRELAEFCLDRGIEIIPECPTLSHADYICLAYPELAERQNDPYPDTYCPSNPRSYQVVFDILDEVIEVFHPKKINIGHDEYYSAGICEKCCGKAPSSIYAEDVRKIKEYLASKGVGTMMWGEKLLKARYPDGEKIGGWYSPQEHQGVIYQIPAMFDCADKMPKGVTYLHWYWEFGEHLDDEYHAREYPAVFGNFSVLACRNFRERIRRGIQGAFVSNWGSNAEEYMQRNFQYLDLVTTAYALWSDTYEDSQREELKERAIRELYAKHNGKIRHPLKVRHCAYHNIPYKYFWCGWFIEDEIYLLGHYRITYSDGTTADLPVKFGTNIGPVHIQEQRNLDEVLYSTLPVKGNGWYLYEHLYENPCPEKKIGKIEYVSMEGKEQIYVDYHFEL